MVATACLFRSASLVAEAARLLGRDEDAVHFADLAEETRAAFVTHYLHDDGTIHSDAPTVYALAIVFGLLDETRTAQAGDRLAALVAEGGYHIQTGFAGTPFVTDALTLTGHLDDAYRLLLQTECPSWLYPVTMDATTIWERWDSMLPDGTINPGEMTSFNHYALGAVADWMHRTIGGIAPGEPGYRTVRVAPRPGGGIDWAKSSLQTPYGLVAVSWTDGADGLDAGDRGAGRGDRGGRPAGSARPRADRRVAPARARDRRIAGALSWRSRHGSAPPTVGTSPPRQETPMTETTVPDQMRASVLTGVRELAVELVPTPAVADDEVLVEVAAVGVCGSDTHYFRHGRIGDFVVTGPLILGHELSGRIVAVGADVPDTRIGERVAVEPQKNCRRCRECRAGHYNLCPNMEFFATPPIDGAFAQYCVIRTEFAHALPDTISDEAAALLEPLSVAITTMRKAGVTPGSSILIAGAGPIGIICAQTARAFGAAEIIVTDLVAERRERALTFGATRVIDPREVDIAACGTGRERVRGRQRVAARGLRRHQGRTPGGNRRPGGAGLAGDDAADRAHPEPRDHRHRDLPLRRHLAGRPSTWSPADWSTWTPW